MATGTAIVPSPRRENSILSQITLISAKIPWKLITFHQIGAFFLQIPFKIPLIALKSPSTSLPFLPNPFKIAHWKSRYVFDAPVVPLFRVSFGAISTSHLTFSLYLLAIDRLRGVHDFFGGGRTLENWGLEMKEIGVGLRVASGKQAVLGMKFCQALLANTACRFWVGIREIPLVFALILTVPIVSLEKWVSPLPEAKIQWKSSFSVLPEIKIHSKSAFPHLLSPKSSISVLRERNIHLQSSLRDCRF